MYEKASLKSNMYLFIIRLLARATEDIFWKEKKEDGDQGFKSSEKKTIHIKMQKMSLYSTTSFKEYGTHLQKDLNKQRCW